ncbi:hypothetical protein ACMZOO_17530 (plasmid) [Catenovulum sp. SX2]|uniref:hypothetical protein n=1 Tax=Catenovulum sp. SX2 TaxID=3398614 RepID=UPI003F82D635
MKIKLFNLVVLFLLAACSCNNELQTSQQPLLEDYTVGEKWVWKYKGVTNDGVVRAEGIDTKQIVNQNGQLAMLTANGPIALEQIVKPVDNNNARYNWPLQVGKKWQLVENWTSEDGTTGSTIQDAEVLSFELETVEAGSFMAYKIKYTGTISNSRGYKAQTEDVHWYAPKLKTFIKLTQTQGDYYYQEELIEYSEG